MKLIIVKKKMVQLSTSKYKEAQVTSCFSTLEHSSQERPLIVHVFWRSVTIKGGASKSLNGRGICGSFMFSYIFPFRLMGGKGFCSMSTWLQIQIFVCFTFFFAKLLIIQFPNSTKQFTKLILNLRGPPFSLE